MSLALVALLGCGESVSSSAETLCENWCLNAAGGHSCCSGSDCGQDCVNDCIANGTDPSCGTELLTLRECQLGAVCNDYVGDCAESWDVYRVCANRRQAPQLCESVAALCEVGQVECVKAFDLEPYCALNWWSFATCIDEQVKNSCAACARTVSSFPECDLPAGQTLENYEGNPPGCLELTPRPEGCGTRCPSGGDEDCTAATYCSARNLCEADCVARNDCADDEICGDDARCVSAPNCVYLPSPPPGCGRSCAGGADTECEMQTYCSDDGLCEADCTRDSECALEEICTLRGRCLPAPNCLDLSFRLLGCAEPCPSGQDAECGFETFCSATGLCDAECALTRDCPDDELCNAGRCEPLPLQCGDNDTLDPADVSVEQTLEGRIMGIPVDLLVTVTGDPPATVVSGDNTFGLQMQLTLPVDTVGFLFKLAREADVELVEANVVPTAGTSATGTVTLAVAPIPCDLLLLEGRAVNMPTAPTEGTWPLDQGSTQELTLKDVTFHVDIWVLSLILSTTGDDPTCTWANDAPPALRFSTP